MRRIAHACLALAALAAGCSSGSSGGSREPTPASGTATAGVSASTAAAPVRRGGANRITPEEIASQNFQNAYEVIERLRPAMLRGRGSVTLGDDTGQSTQPLVYVDNTQYGSIETLKSIPAMQVREIQLISKADATTRWGTGHTGGVILILTKGGGMR